LDCDGKYIRDNVEEEFTNYGQHYQFRFIPRWILIDKERSPGEESTLLILLLAMNRLMLKHEG